MKLDPIAQYNVRAILKSVVTSETINAAETTGVNQVNRIADRLERQAAELRGWAIADS